MGSAILQLLHARLWRGITNFLLFSFLLSFFPTSYKEKKKREKSYSFPFNLFNSICYGKSLISVRLHFVTIRKKQSIKEVFDAQLGKFSSSFSYSSFDFDFQKGMFKC